MSYEGPHPIPVKSGGSGSASLTGVLTGNGTTPFTASAVSQYNALVGGASNLISSVAPSAASGIALISQGVAANPTFGTVVVSGGGTGATTLTAHSVLIGNGTGAIVQVGPVASTGCVLSSNGVGSDPGFTTATYPLTTTVSQILYSSATNTITGLATANRGVLTTGTTGVPVITALATDGQVIVGSTAGAPAAATLTAGAGISIANGSNTITITATGSGFSWSAIGGSQTLAVSSGYFCTSGGALSLALPAVSAVGDSIQVVLDGSTSWTITQPNAATRIRMGSVQTTLGVGGSLASTAQGDTVELVCETANARWVVVDMIGNITYV